MKKQFIIISLILIILTFATTYYGSNDIGDYADTSKFFAGEYSAKIRNPHTWEYGIIHAPFVKLTNNFISFKITSLIFLFLIIFSVYVITKDKKALWLMILSPVVWYMSPWISPIQMSSLFLLWSYYFINEYDKKGKISNLILSGLLGGFALNFWYPAFYFGVILTTIFFYNKKLNHLFIFMLSIFMGLIPNLVLDYYLFNFPLYTIIKGTGSIVVGFILTGVYTLPYVESKITVFKILLIFLAIPIYFWKLYKPSIFRENKKTMIFLSFSLILLIYNPQIRILFVLIPIITIILSKNLTKKQFKNQIIISIVIILIVIFPYILQINNNWDGDLNGKGSINQLLVGSDAVYFSDFDSKLIREDLEKITTEYPNEVFLVGNKRDYYQSLAHIYWGNKIKEFVSIEDYNLVINNETTIFSKKFSTSSNINNRRLYWIEGGLDKKLRDDTDYNGIKLAIGVNEPIELDGFIVIKKYNQLYLSERLTNNQDNQAPKERKE